ncbi:MAG TPA: hypothetical protein VHV76_13945 [Mycobacteriales bacterium]|nr:hypothetical protein [Mycobacteriales bacterium]
MTRGRRAEEGGQPAQAEGAQDSVKHGLAGRRLDDDGSIPA